MAHKSPSTSQVAAAYRVLKDYGVSRWAVETALKAALNEETGK